MIKTITLSEMTEEPGGTELTVTPSRLSVLGLITRTANDLGNHHEGQSMIYGHTPRQLFTKELVRLKPRPPAVSGSYSHRTF